MSDTYRIRTVTDDKDEGGKAITSVYAEAAFYDLSFSVKKEESTFTADTADVPMAYALQGTESEKLPRRFRFQLLDEFRL